MPGTVKIWWHDGATKDVRYNALPVVNEPEVGFETVAVSSSPSATGPAPDDVTVALVETDVAVRYLVRRPGDNAEAGAVSSKPLGITGHNTDVIGVAPGYTISFIEA